MFKPTSVTIEDVWFNPTSNKLHQHFYEVPDEYDPPKPEQRLKSAFRNPKLLGKRTNLPKTYFLGVLLYQNEVQGCMTKGADRHGLVRALRKEYPTDWTIKNTKYYLKKFSEYRKAYNEGTLIPDTPMPALYCWNWNAHGFIRHNIRISMMLNFDYCYRMLKTEKFMDPRFFKKERILEVHKNRDEGDTGYDDWHIPLIADIEAIEKKIEKPLYKSITFPPGFED